MRRKGRLFLVNGGKLHAFRVALHPFARQKELNCQCFKNICSYFAHPKHLIFAVHETDFCLEISEFLKSFVKR